ncbi:heavy metal transporter [Streptomyces gobitricini]|uniref:Heavy metal transporter n=1 Tax=Streptomyces gobitricini TaxID=68211 RepID=A0ABN3LEN1_9ACTN
MSESTRPRRPRVAVALAVLLALIGYVVVQYATGRKDAPHCVVGSGTNTYRVTPEQASNAATISAVGTSRGMPERAVTIALATALQESALRNIRYGDRDSLGLFQQRPSQGWGTEKQILDPVFSAGKFYDHLVEVPGYSRLPLTVAAQRVQRSGFPQAYAKHEPDAALLAAALTGRSAASLTCTTERGPVRAGDPARVRAELRRAFGGQALPGGGTAPDISVPVPTVAAGAAGPEGETPGGGSRGGWELAQWAVARADALGLAEVSYAGRVWSAAESREGWRTTGDAPRTDEVRIRVTRG